MTNPDPCFKDSPGSRITAGLLLALLCLSLLLSAGCARLIPPVKEEPALPLVLVKERKLPEFFDDMSFDALSAAIDQSLAYLRSKSPETQFRFGEETYSATHMIRSLENFTTSTRRRRLESLYPCQLSCLSVCGQPRSRPDFSNRLL